jgi:hypothetical protein
MKLTYYQYWTYIDWHGKITAKNKEVHYRLEIGP